MAGKEMEFAIKVGGYLSQKLTTAVGNTTKLLKGLGDTGEQVTEKLKSIQTIDAKQKKLEAQTGKLRDAVRSHLRRHRQGKAFRPGVYGEGEDGVTIVTL